ncbi:MAG: endonuclease/exonuclease/phosphatase family protein [Chlorobi bacterium]|nr:endonuclease/exonuclease/phosphatase family protein [Chlorobiota bacterium]
MTFNIRYDNPNDGENSWAKRKGALVDLIKSYRPGIIGLQEGLDRQLKYIERNLPDYSMIGVGREDGKTKGEYSAIFFNTQKFNLLKQSTFWLSEKEDTGSVGWDAALARTCTFGLFEERSASRRVWVFNTHYDHIGATARKMSSKLILKKIRAANKENYPVILLGDLNSEPESDPVKILKKELNDGLEFSRKKFSDPVGTFNGFEENPSFKSRIDYIFVKNLEVENYRRLTDRRKNNLWISDHLPVMAELKFIPGK